MHSFKQTAARTLISFMVLAIGACTTTTETPVDHVSGRVELFDRVSAALTTNSILAVKGSYGATCTARTGTWTLALNGYVLGAEETALTVVSNDAACVLSVTEVKSGTATTSQSFKPAAPFVLASVYAAQGVAFSLVAAGPTQFYANFRLQPDLLFTSDMVLQMVYSDTVSETDVTTIASYNVVVSTATAALVPAPNATLSLTGLVIKVDAHNLVKSATGTLILKQGTVAAQQYAVDADTAGSPPTYASLETAFNLAVNTRVTMTPGAAQNIGAAELTLVGLDLTTPKKRNIILTNSLSGVTSYQVFQLTIAHP